MPTFENFLGYTDWRTPRTTFADQACAQTFNALERWLSGEPQVGKLRIAYDDPTLTATPQSYYVPTMVYVVNGGGSGPVKGVGPGGYKNMKTVAGWWNSTTDANGDGIVNTGSIFKEYICLALATRYTGSTTRGVIVYKTDLGNLNTHHFRMWDMANAVEASQSRQFGFFIVGM